MCARRARAAVGDRRQLIIDAARKLFASRPYDQVTTSEIAKNAEVAYGLIAHHFENKRGLYLAVMNEIAVEIAAVQLTPPPHDASVVDPPRDALRNPIAYIRSNYATFVAALPGPPSAHSRHQATTYR